MVAPLVYSREEPPEAALRAAEEQWARRDITGRRDQFVVCFIGTLSRRLAREGFLSDSIAALSLLGRECPGLRIVVCGGGEDLPRWKGFAESHPRMLAVGRVNRAELWTLLQRSSVGLVPYPNSPDFVRSIPNKVAEVPVDGSPDCLEPGWNARPVPSRETLRDHLRAGRPNVARTTHSNPVYFERGVWSAMSNSATRAFADHFVADQVYGDMARHLEAMVDRRLTPRAAETA